MRETLGLQCLEQDTVIAGPGPVLEHRGDIGADIRCVT